MQLMEGQCIDSRDPPLSLDTGPGLGRSKTELLVGELWRVVTKTGTFSTQATTKALGYRSRRSPRV